MSNNTNFKVVNRFGNDVFLVDGKEVTLEEMGTIYANLIKVKFNCDMDVKVVFDTNNCENYLVIGNAWHRLKNKYYDLEDYLEHEYLTNYNYAIRACKDLFSKIKDVFTKLHHANCETDLKVNIDNFSIPDKDMGS